MAVNTITTTELTATQVAHILTQPLEIKSIFLASGPIIYDTAGPMKLPAAPPYTGTSLPFTGESTPIPEHDADFGEVSLLPSTMQSVKVITRYSNELARQSVVALEAALRNRLVLDVAGRLDEQFFSATGDGTTIPQGMFAWSGVSNVPITGNVTFDHLLAAQGVALGVNANIAALRLFLRPADWIILQGQKDTQQRYQLTPNPTLGAVPSVLGMPVSVSPRIPSGCAAVADMSQVAVARDLAPSVTILSERYADYDEQAVRVVARYDVKPINPLAVVTITGIGTTTTARKS